MARVAPLADRRRHIMRQAAKRWAKRGGVEQALSQLAASDDSGAADTPTRQRQFAARAAMLQRAAELRAAGRLPIGLERKIGSTLDFVENAPSEAARRAGLPVARIVSDCDPQVQAEGFATGFMVAPRLLLTNWHVFPDAGSARGNGANFFHERGEQGVAIGETFELDPDYFFLSNERLDFAMVGIKAASVRGAALAGVDPAAMTSSPAKILIGQPVNIIQHPDGGPKTWVTEKDNRLTDLSDDGFLQYTADTLGGSSGAPVFSKAWELVGVHHSGVPEMHDGKIVAIDGSAWNEDMGDDRVHWVANEGIRVSGIIRVLSETRLDDARQQAVLDALLDGTGDPAEEVRELLERTSHPPIESEPGAAPLLRGGGQMIFTGPVTIILGQEASDALAGAAGALERSIRFDPDYANRRGYRPDFLGGGVLVPLPGVARARKAEMLVEDGEVRVLDYHHFSLAMNARYRLAMWSAANVDYDPVNRQVGGRTGFGSDRWIYDPRIPAELQVGERDFYGPAGQADRGHVVRRQDSAWGATPIEIEYANSDTFHWTNCTPQHAAFNRASAPSRYDVGEGLWGGFEMYIQSELQKDDARACIFAGPVLSRDDPVEDFGRGPVHVPRLFWKVVVVRKAGAEPSLEAHGFILSQEDVVTRFGVEFAAGRFSRYRTTLSDIGKAAGVAFDRTLIAADTFRGSA